MNVVRRGDDVIEVQGTGEHGTFNRARLDELLDGAAVGINERYLAQRAALGI